MKKIKGMITPMVTPFCEDETINYDAFKILLDRLVESRMHCILVGGSTGEYSLMTMAERKAILELAVKQVDRRALVIAGCSCARTEDTIEMVRHAEKTGADFALVLPPYYMQTSRQGIIDYYSEVAGSADIGIVIYHYPHATAVRLDPELISDLARIKNVVAVKDTDVLANTAKLIDLTKDVEDFEVINGEEYNILGTLALGGAGCMGILYNLVPAEMVEIYEAIQANDIHKAREINNRLMPLYALMEEEPYPGPIKAALELMGLPAGRPRKPIVPASQEMIEKLRQGMTKAGIL